MDKETLKVYLLKTIRWLAIQTIKKYQPSIIAVTGSVGKTSTKEAIYVVLKDHRKTRANKGNFNSDLGLPLTILGDWKADDFFLFSRENPVGEKQWEKAQFLFKVISIGLLRLIFGFRKNYPEILVLEYAADKPGDLKYLLDIAKPQIGVITAIGEIPVHIESYSSPEAVAREKVKVIEALPAVGFAVLNYDDETVLDLQDRTRAHLFTYGFDSNAGMKITNFENLMDNERPIGIIFKLNYAGSFLPVKLEGVFGKAQAYAAAAAACIGIIYGSNLVKISKALSQYKAPIGRGQLINGVKGSYIIDDSYNASPLSMLAAVDTINSIKAKRKIAVLGDMLEIGKYTEGAHKNVGKAAAKVFDILFTVGERAKFIAEAAKEAGM